MCFDPAPLDLDTVTVEVSRAGIRDAVLDLRCYALRAVAACKDVLDRMADRSDAADIEQAAASSSD